MEVEGSLMCRLILSSSPSTGHTSWQDSWSLPSFPMSVPSYHLTHSQQCVLCTVCVCVCVCRIRQCMPEMFWT